MARDRKNPSSTVFSMSLWKTRRGPVRWTAFKRMKKRMAERILEADDHLGYEKHAPDGRNRGNSRNGKTTKTLKDERAL